MKKPWEQTWARGEWVADHEGYDCINVEEPDGNNFVVEVHDLRRREREETELLAAFLAAAPDVYRSLKEMLDASKDGVRPDALMIYRAIAALRRARGETP